VQLPQFPKERLLTGVLREFFLPRVDDLLPNLSEGVEKTNFVPRLLPECRILYRTPIIIVIFEMSTENPRRLSIRSKGNTKIPRSEAPTILALQPTKTHKIVRKVRSEVGVNTESQELVRARSSSDSCLSCPQCKVLLELITKKAQPTQEIRQSRSEMVSSYANARRAQSLQPAPKQ